MQEISVQKFRGGERTREDDCYHVRANTKIRQTVTFILPDLQKILGSQRKGKSKLRVYRARDSSALVEMPERVSTVPPAA